MRSIKISDEVNIRKGQGLNNEATLPMMGIVDLYIDDRHIFTSKNLVMNDVLNYLSESMFNPLSGTNIRSANLMDEAFIIPGSGPQDNKDGIAFRRVTPSPTQGDPINIQRNSLVTTIESPLVANSVRFKGVGTVGVYQSDPDFPDYIDQLYLGRSYGAPDIFQKIFAILNADTEDGTNITGEPFEGSLNKSSFRYPFYDDETITIYWQLLIL